MSKRQELFGPNELEATPEPPWWRKLLSQFQDPLIYLLFVAMGISLVAWILEGAHGVPVDVIVIAAIVIINAVIGMVEEAKAADAVAALAEMTKATSTVIRDGQQLSVESDQLVPGDILLLSEGDAVGADSRVLESTNLLLEEASLTGESEPTLKSPDTLEGKIALGDRDNMVFRGTAVVQGVGKAVVTQTGMKTQMGQIAKLLDETEQAPTPLEVEIEKISKMLGIIVIAIAVIVMVALGLINRPDGMTGWVDILLIGVSLAVAAVPEGLPAIMSLVLAIGVRELAKHNAIMKSLQSVETLGSASVICSDKTGTLTRNEMTIQHIVTASGQTSLSGVGYEPTGEIKDTTNDQARAEAMLTVFGGAVANNAQLDQVDDSWQIQGDPTEAAFLVAWPKMGGDRDPAELERAAEVPFNSDRKMMSVVADGTMYTKGAPDVLIDHCTSRRVGEEVFDLGDDAREDIKASITELSEDGYRTLGVAYKPFEATEADESDEQDLIFVGTVAILDPPREEAVAAITEAHRAGIRTVMITGDHPVTAAKIASDLGVTDNQRALTGNELDEMSPEEFHQAVREVDVYARVAPEHKIRIVEALQADDHIVSMTGDGVNDAPALKASNIGVAMGITGTEVTKQAATMILADDNYATIIEAIRRGRGVFDNIRKFLRYLLSSNMGEVATVFFGIVFAGVIGLATEDGSVIVPLLATQILWINLVTDSFPALAMGVDPTDEDVMARQPRDPSQRIIDREMWAHIIAIGLVMGASTLFTLDYFLPGGLIDGTDSIETARTAAFTTLVFAQLFNAFNARSQTESAFAHMFTNKWLWLAIAVAFLLQIAVVEVGFMQVAFGTTSLELRHWLVAIAASSVVLWFEEIVKLIKRAVSRNS